MIIRKLKQKHYEQLRQHLMMYGKMTPMSMQYDYDMTCNHKKYVLKVQLDKNMVIGLQALEANPKIDGYDCELITKNNVINTLLELLILQSQPAHRDVS